MSDQRERRVALRRAADRRREQSRFRLQVLTVVLLAMLGAALVYIVATYPY